MIWTRRKTEGFALPTILIASVVMLIVLVSAITATESIRSALDRQYYNELAREAAESGLAYASYCLQQNSYTPSWSSSYPLRADRDCTGVNSNGVSQYIINQNNVRMSFSVAYPTNMSVSQLVSSTGTVELLRPSSGQPWRSYTYSASARIGVTLSLNTVAFGYAYGSGAYFGTLLADGTLRMAGFNGWGQLGNGTYNDALLPTKFQMNGTDKPVNVFTNFVSGGHSVYVLANSGQIWGAGYNGNGELGNGTTTTSANAVQFGLPSGKTGQYVAINGFDTYALTTDGNIYAAGACANGQLGYNYTISGCTDQSVPKRVNLPAVTSDPNTIPTTNITTDYLEAFVRMQGGKVYGWGADANSIFGSSSAGDTSNPVQIGTFGNTGQPTARQIFTDGISLWIVDSNGTLWGQGANMYGQLGGQNISIFYNQASHCLDNKTGDGVTIWLYPCNGTGPQQFTFQTDGTIYNANKNVCLNNVNHSSANQAPVNLAICDGTSAQRWQMRADGTLYNTAYNVCLDNLNGDGTNLQLYGCLSNANQTFSLPDQGKLVQFNLPAQAGSVTKIWTDQWFVEALTSNGQVWGAGLNDHGYLGAGSIWTHQNFPVQFILPSGVTAVDLYATCSNPSDDKYCNTFVIGSDGKVYGAGSNYFGQLGDGTTTDRSTPVAMQTIDGVNIKALQVESGYGTTIVIADNHKVYTVGNNSNGQLGDGTTNNSSIPKANQYTNALPITEF